MKNLALFLFTVLIISQSGVYSQEPDNRYVRETDPLVMKNILSFLLFLLIISTSITVAQEPEGRYVPETDPLVLDKLEKWQDLKFGLLMHWGTYSQWGIVESWSICSEDEGWCRRSKS